MINLLVIVGFAAVFLAARDLVIRVEEAAWALAFAAGAVLRGAMVD